MHPNKQQQYCDNLLYNGSAFNFVGQVMEETMQEDHLPALTRDVYLQHAGKLDERFTYDTATALILLHVGLEKSSKIVCFGKKEVGVLIRFPQGSFGNATGIALVDFLLDLPNKMALSDAQLWELEYLLNKAGHSLEVTLPTLLPATEEEKKAALMKLALSVMKSKPKLHYQNYLDALKSAGTPVTMTQKEFIQFAEENLRP